MRVRNLPFYFLSRIGFYKEIKVGRTDSKNMESPVYYIIRRALRWGDAGFFSNYFFVLSHYAYALHRNWRPVVDMRNYTTLYSERQPVEGERNAWNYFFRQPFKTGDAYRSGRFVLSEARLPAPRFNPIMESDSTCEINPTVAPELFRIATTDLTIRPQLSNRFEEEFESLFGGKKVLGIHYRGGDKHNPPPGHRPSISTRNLLLAVDELVKLKPDVIFLASDEDGVAALVRSVTNIPVVQLQAFRLPSGSHEGLHLQNGSIPRSLHRYLLGLEVLRDAWFLSRCDFLIHGHSNVSNAAMFFRGKPFEAKHLIQSGSRVT